MGGGGGGRIRKVIFFFFFLGGGGGGRGMKGSFLCNFWSFLKFNVQKKELDGDSLGVAKISILFIYLFLN